MPDSGETHLSCLSLIDLSQVLSQMHSAKALAVVACTSKLWKAASDLAFRDLCISTGRKVAHKPVCDVTGAAAGCTASESNSSQLLHAQHQLPLGYWRGVYFQQSHALSFNGINDYVALPVGLLNLPMNTFSERLCSGVEPLGLTIDLMVSAHQVPASPPQEPSASATKAALPPAGGMLFGCQDREFGRSRRAARLHTLPLLYVGTDGYLHSAIGPMSSSQMLADDQWHRVTLTIFITESFTQLGNACMYVDGVLDKTTYGWDFSNLPSYSVLGSGITEGCSNGASTPVYNCHSFHGLIDELRLWARPLQRYEVQELAWQRVAFAHDMPYAHRMIGSWSLTEGKGGVMHNHITAQSTADCLKPWVSTCIDGQLGAVSIPSAHHTYSSVSNLVDCIPEQARSSIGPVWIHSDAPVEGELIMDFCDSTDYSLH